MAIRFGEIKKYLARNVRLSVYKKDDHYDDYLMVSDIPECKYDDYFVYGVGMIDVEFSQDEYAEPEGMDFIVKDMDLKPAIEIVIQKEPREIERKDEWCHDADEWLGIYTSRKEAKEAYDRAVVWWGEENKTSRYNTPQEVTLFEYILKDDRFRKVSREELED